MPKIKKISPTCIYDTYLFRSVSTGSNSGGSSLTMGIVDKSITYAMKVFRMYRWYAGCPRWDREGIVRESSVNFSEISVTVPTGITYSLVADSPNSTTISSLTVNSCAQMGWMYSLEESSLLYLLKIGACFLTSMCSTENEDDTDFCSLSPFSSEVMRYLKQKMPFAAAQFMKPPVKGVPNFCS